MDAAMLLIVALMDAAILLVGPHGCSMLLIGPHGCCCIIHTIFTNPSRSSISLLLLKLQLWFDIYRVTIPLLLPHVVVAIFSPTHF